MNQSTRKQQDAERRARMRPIAAELPGLVGKPMGRRGFGEGGLIADWAAIVGAEVARHAKPLRLSFPRGERRDGSLVLRVRSAFAVELQHMAPQGLDPAEEKKLARDLGRIEDPELRQALEDLGRAVKGLRRHPNPAK